MFGLEGIIMQAATIPAPAADPNITAIGGIITGVGAAIGTVITYLKSKEGSEVAKSFALIGLRKSTESKAATLKSILSPEEKAKLAEELKEEIIIGLEQEKKLLEKDPKADPVKKLPDLPRESFDTKPKVTTTDD